MDMDELLGFEILREALVGGGAGAARGGDGTETSEGVRTEGGEWEVKVEGGGAGTRGLRGSPVTTASWSVNFEKCSLLSAADASKSTIALSKSSFSLPLDNMAATHRLLILDLSSPI